MAGSGRDRNGGVPASTTAAGVDDANAEQQDEQSQTRHAERDRCLRALHVPPSRASIRHDRTGCFGRCWAEFLTAEPKL
jgi:hypothetical protein